MAGRFDQFNQAHDRLLDPGEWSIDHGKLVFLVENQAVVVWGVDATEWPGEDPPVFQAINEPGEPAEWGLEHARCSEFLLVQLHLQAVRGGLSHLGMVEITPHEWERFVDGWSFVGRVNEVRAYHKKGRAACVLEDEGSSELYVGGRTEQDFDAIRAELSDIGVAIDHL